MYSLSISSVKNIIDYIIKPTYIKVIIGLLKLKAKSSVYSLKVHVFYNKLQTIFIVYFHSMFSFELRKSWFIQVYIEL